MLTRASQMGVSINQITYVKRDIVIFTDACETGIGGYTPMTGKAWRYALPEWMQKLTFQTKRYKLSAHRIQDRAGTKFNVHKIN